MIFFLFLPVAQRKYAQRVVKDILGKEIDKALRIANEADAKLQAARQAVAAAKHSAHASHQHVESKSSVVAHLRQEVERLTKEKDAAEHAKLAAKKAADHAERQEKVAAEELEKAKQQVDSMRILVTSREEEARRAREAANTARQESTDCMYRARGEVQLPDAIRL